MPPRRPLTPVPRARHAPLRQFPAHLNFQFFHLRRNHLTPQCAQSPCCLTPPTPSAPPDGNGSGSPTPRGSLSASRRASVRSVLHPIRVGTRECDRPMKQSVGTPVEPDRGVPMLMEIWWSHPPGERQASVSVGRLTGPASNVRASKRVSVGVE